MKYPATTIVKFIKKKQQLYQNIKFIELGILKEFIDIYTDG